MPGSSAIKFRTRGADTEADLESASWSSYYTTSGDSITTANFLWLEIELLLESGSTPELDEFGVDYEEPTLVSLVEFKAIGLFGKVLVKWQTASEFQNAGFNIYRASSPFPSDWVKLNQSLISGLGNSLSGKAYHFTDYEVTDGETYYYWLETIDFYGNKALYGPAEAHPGRDTDGDGMTDDWEIYYGLDPYRDDSQEDPDGDGLTNLEEFLRGTDPLTPDQIETFSGSGGSGELFEGLTPWSVWAKGLAGSSGTIEEGVRIISSDDSGIVLEMLTARFNAIPKQLAISDTIYQVLEIPGYIHGYTAEAGKAQMPLKPVLLGIPQGVVCSIEDLEIDAEVISPTGYNIYPAPGYEDTYLGESLDSPTLSKIIIAPDAGFYNSTTDYPSEVVQLVGTTSLRGQSIACLNLYPLTYNPAEKQLKIFYRIRFKLAFSQTREILPPPEEEDPILPPPVPQLKIAITQSGIYRLGYYDIWDAGFQDINWLDPHELKVYHHEQEIPIRVIGEADGVFDLDDYIEFYAAGTQTKYSATSIYWLTYSEGDGARMASQTSLATPATITPTCFASRARAEKNDLYWHYRAGDEETDRWLWYSSITHDQQKDYQIYLPDLSQVDPAVSVTLRAAYYGIYDYSPHPNHHTRVYLNATLIDDAWWDGQIEYISAVSVTQPTMLLNGNNTITLKVLSDTGTEEDLVVPNYFEVEYWRDFQAISDTLEFSYSADGVTRFVVSGYTQPELEVFDITEPVTPEYITGFEVNEVAGLYTLSFKDGLSGTKKTYLVLGTAEARSPAWLELDQPSDLKLTANQADYLMIVHQDFRDSILPLADLHRTNGLTTKVIDIEDIYDEFNGGQTSPYAIRDFLKYAYEYWERPAPIYVLLVGDASYDYKNYLGYGETNYVPTYLVPETPYWGETGSDNWLVCLDGESDFLPDMFIGRLPVRTSEELEAVVQKLVAYHQGPIEDWHQNILLATDLETVFKNTSDSLILYLTSTLKGGTAKRYISPIEHADYAVTSIKELYLGETECPSATDLKTGLVDWLTQGTLWLNYAGHGWEQGWLQTPNTFKPATLAWNNPGRYPFIASFTCRDGYYLDPEPGEECIAEILLRKEAAGSIGYWSATGMGLPSGHEVLNQELVRVTFEQGDRRFGSATTRAKLNLFARTGDQYQDLIQTYHLFGDPALSLKRRGTRRIMTYLSKALSKWDTGKAIKQVVEEAEASERPTGFEAIYAETLLNYEAAKRWRDLSKSAEAK